MCLPQLKIEECASREKSKISRSASDRIESVGAEKTIILEDGYKDPATKALISELHPLNWHYLDDVFALEASNDNVSDSDITWVTLEDEHNLVLDFVNASGPAAMGIAVLSDVADSVKSVELNGHNIALNFDLLVDSADSTTDSIIIKMESGDEGANDLAAGQVSWSLDELTLDDWVSYSIPVTDFLNTPQRNCHLILII
jgi:hypothetical protein